MTRQDYVLLAGALQLGNGFIPALLAGALSRAGASALADPFARLKDDDGVDVAVCAGVDTAVREIADALASDNPHFDRETFLAAVYA